MQSCTLIAYTLRRAYSIAMYKYIKQCNAACNIYVVIIVSDVILNQILFYFKTNCIRILNENQ